MENDQTIIQEVEFYNTLAFTQKKIEFGKHGIFVQGPNESFKTCILEGVQAGTSGGSKGDMSLVTDGQKKGKIVITIQNGDGSITKVTKTLHADKASTVDVTGRSDAATYLKEIFGAGYINPIEFYNAKPDYRMEKLLKVMPFEFDRKLFSELIGMKIPSNTSALAEIDSWHKKYFKDRAEANSAQKAKRSSAEEYERTLPIDDPIAPSARLAELRDKKANAEGEYKVMIAKADATRDARKSALETARDEAIKKATNEYNQGIEELTAKVSKYKNEMNAAHIKTVSLLDGEMGTLLEQEKNADRIAEQRKLCTKLKLKADLAKDEWEYLDKIVKAIEATRENLLKALPKNNLGIEVDIKDNEIWLDGFPWIRANKAKRMLYSNYLAEQSCGRMKLIFFDDIESLDKENYQVFIDHVKQSEYQYVALKVGDGDENGNAIIQKID